WIMGDFPPTQDPNVTRFTCMEPTWCYPLEFQSGLFVQLVGGETWYCGFHRGPLTLRAQRADAAGGSADIPIANPFTDDVAVRLVQTGGSVYLQAQTLTPQQNRGCLGPLFPA